LRREEIPRAGLLADARVISTGVVIAGPMTAGLLGEFGAEGIDRRAPDAYVTLGVACEEPTHAERSAS
jgi:crotonobetainyl-CoA:carnitine CoA-transferase CaiB-like acyl-CoA transferase